MTNAPRTFDQLLVLLGGLSALVGLLFLVSFNFSFLFSAEALPFLVVHGVGLALAIVCYVSGRPWTYLAGGIGVTLFPLMVMAFFGYEVLQHPEAGNPWIGVLFLLLAVALALPAGIRGFARARKRAPQAGAAEGWLTGSGLVTLAVVALVLGASLASSLTTSSLAESPVARSGFDFEPEATVTTTTRNAEYHPRALDVPAGKIVEIAITNEDGEYHDFTYEANGKTYTHPILPESQTSFLVRLETAGTIPYRCQPHSEGYGEDAGMTGTIVVA